MATKYGYLVDPNKQFQYKNGRNLTSGYLRVFDANTDDPAPTYKNWALSPNPQDITLDDNGRAVVICDSSKSYRLEVFSYDGELLWTIEPLACMAGGGSTVNTGIQAIISTDQTVSVSVNGGTADLGISDTLLSGTRSAEAWCGNGIMTAAGAGVLSYSASATAVSGTGIQEQGGKVFLGNNGIYHVDAQVNYGWTGALSPVTDEVNFFGNGNASGKGEYDFSYTHSETRHFGFDVWASAAPQQVEIDFSGAEGFTAEVVDLQVHRVAQQFGQAGGLSEVIHDTSLTGNGTTYSALGVNPDFISGKQDISGMSAYMPASASGDYVTNSSFSSYSSNNEQVINNISAFVSGLTGTYIEQSASSMFQPSGNYVSAADMSAYVPFSGISGVSGQITGISGSAIRGHEYTGVWPVDVDNTADRISVAHIPLCVDETMTGFRSGDSAVIGVNTGTVLSGLSAYATNDSLSGYIPVSALGIGEL